MNIIEIKNLNKSYGQLKAVDNISFCVHEGQTFAFLGSNGAGKSTTINIICGILEKDSGEIYINGINVEKNIAEIKKKIGIVFQQSVLDKALTVYENLKNKAMLYGLSKKEFDEKLNFLANELDFNDLLQRPIKKLSGGQARKVDLARSLIHSPKILILDEPTTGLDPQTRQKVWSFLDKLKDQFGLTILTTHYLEEASDADYVVILDKGIIVAEDTPINLKKKYTHDFVKIYNKRGKKEVVEALQKEGYRVSIKKEFIQLELKNTEEIKKLIIKSPEIFDDFEVIKGKMDDVFLRVTDRKLEDE